MIRSAAIFQPTSLGAYAENGRWPGLNLLSRSVLKLGDPLSFSLNRLVANFPPYNPPAWTCCNGGLWPQYEYLFHHVLKLDQPFTYYMGNFMVDSRLAWLQIGFLVVGSVAWALHRTLHSPSWKMALALVPALAFLVLYAHVIESAVTYGLI